MASPVSRVRVQWDGTAVEGPSITTFYSGASTPDIAKVTAFFTALKSICPTGLQWTIPEAGDVLDVNSGQITGSWTATGGGPVVATGAGNFVRGSGARIVWETGAVNRGRHVRGSTFIVPLIAAQYSSTGQIASTAINVLKTAADALIAGWGGALCIWTRPKPGAFNAGTSVVTSSRVPINPTQLRSRRV